jgi:hypothetical protein
MKRKPMLLDKILAKSNGRGREVIGLIGTHHGVGVTHTALMLAFYMGEELGKKTALLECNKHHDMCLIEKAYEWNREEASFFAFHKIAFYSEVSQNHIIELFGENFDCFILDFGTDLIGNKEEFLRCGTKIVVGGRSEWDKQKLYRFVTDTKIIHGSESWLYFIPQADGKTITNYKKEIDRKTYAVPINQEPTRLSYHLNHFFSTLF